MSTMKTIVTLVTGLGFMLLTSCQFSEKIYINEDGSGQVIFSMDASEMMGFMGQMGDDASEGMGRASSETGSP